MEKKTFKEIYSNLYNTDHYLKYQGLEKFESLLSGFDFDTEKEQGLLMLAKLSQAGGISGVKYLLDKGVNVHLESTEICYRSGPALLFTLQGITLDADRASTSKKGEIIKLLHEYGSDINAQVEWYSEFEKTEVMGNYIEFGLYLGKLHLNAEPSKYSNKELLELRTLLPIFRDLGIKLSEEVSKELNNFLSTGKKIKSKSFPKRVKKRLEVKDRIRELPEAVKEVCQTYLSDESLMESKEWAELIKYIINISLTFEEVAKEVYEDEYEDGLTIQDDEGWLCQGWEEYNWFSELLEILSKENSLRNTEWDSLLILLIKEHRKYSVDIKYEIEKLFEEPWMQSHTSFQKLKDTADQYLSN